MVSGLRTLSRRLCGQMPFSAGSRAWNVASQPASIKLEATLMMSRSALIDLFNFHLVLIPIDPPNDGHAGHDDSDACRQLMLQITRT